MLFKRQLLLIVVVSFFSSLLQAQEYKFEIGGAVGGSYYMGDANKTKFFKGINPSVGLLLRYNTNFRWSVKTNLLWGKISGNTKKTDNVFPNNKFVSFSRNFMELGGQMEFNFFPYSDKFTYLNTKRFSPYVLAGLGITVAPGGEQTFVSLNIPLGVGLKYKVKERLNLGLECSFRKLFGDGFEGDDSLKNPYQIKSGFFKNKDWYSLMLFTITWDFGLRDCHCNNKFSNGLY